MAKNEQNDELKDLPPEERIKKLKELEKQRKKEIAEAEKLIQESESELTERRKWIDRVPIPQFAQEGEEGLSDEGKIILEQKMVRRIEPKNEGTVEKKEGITPVVSKKKESLEEAVSEAARGKLQGDKEYALPREAMAFQGYQIRSEKPMGELYKEAMTLQGNVEERGYATGGEMARAAYLEKVVEQREQAVEKGYYSFTEQTAQQASFMKSVMSSVREMYQEKREPNVGHEYKLG